MDPTLEEHALRLLPDLDELAGQLEADTGEALPKLAKVRAWVGRTAFGGNVQEMTQELERERRELLDLARRAVDALRERRDLNVPLKPDEETGVQILLAFNSRPAIVVQGDRFGDPPAVWSDLDSLYRSEIETVLPSVCRVDMAGHPKLSWAGTGWVAAPGLVMTNRHVVERFAVPAGGAGQETRWHIKDGMTAWVDFGREKDAPADEARVFDVLADAPVRVHPVHDLALVPVARTSRASGAPLPDPLKIAADGSGIGEGRKVYVTGHPAREGLVPERRQLLHWRLFDALFDVKRLQPGEVMQVLSDKGTLLHDCSTLGGNSGSPVVDLDTGQVVSLHYVGIHRYANLAVALWMLADAPLLREAGVRFGQA